MTGKMDRAYLKRPAAGTPTPRAERSLAVLVVNDTTPELLEACLGSVAEHLPELPVYVYGNSAEHPGSADATRRSAVNWVCAQGELGFAAAVNELVTRTPADADLLLLNARARVLGPLRRTREWLRRPHVAAVSPMVRDDTAPGRQPWDIATRRSTLIGALVAAAGYSDSLRGTPISPLYARQPPESQDFTGYLGIACLAINRVAWHHLGGFDEEFFRGGEAADWQARARAAGWMLVLADELGVEGADLLRREGAVMDVESRRNRNLARASAALHLEHHSGVHRADAYLAGTALLDRLQRTRRADQTTIGVSRSADLPTVVISTNRLVYGGAERQKTLLATELERRGYSVAIVCVQRFGPLVQEIPPTVSALRLPWWAPMVDIPEGQAVLITADTNTEAGFATLWRAAANNRRWLVAPHVPPEENRPIYSRLLTAAMRRADGFIVLAQRHWDMLIAQHRLWGRQFIAPNGVASISDPSPRTRTASEPLHLVMLSRILEHKNPHLLVEALNGLADMPWRLSIFGDGPDRERLQALTPARLGDRVQWLGWTAGPGTALADADLLCVPSRSEAFPLVILEAMARAVPVVASAICAVPEMLDFGRAGFLVEPVSVSGWRERLAQILADSTALPAVGRRGFERMRTHYTVQAMTDAYVDAIHAVL